MDKRTFSPHAILITGGTAAERLEKANLPLTPTPNHLVLEPEEEKVTIGIDQVRHLKRWIVIKPNQDQLKTILIPEAQRLTTPAQNSLLKTLEEPPAYARITLTAPNTASLIPTIVSRCSTRSLTPRVEVALTSARHQEAVKDLINILKEGRGEALNWSATYKEKVAQRSDALNILDSWISVLRDIVLIRKGDRVSILNKEHASALTDLASLYQPSWGTNLEEINQIMKKTNVNARIALEVFLLRLW